MGLVSSKSDVGKPGYEPFLSFCIVFLFFLLFLKGSAHFLASGGVIWAPGGAILASSGAILGGLSAKGGSRGFPYVPWVPWVPWIPCGHLPNLS